MDWTAALLSLRVAGCSTAVLLAAGLPVAWWLATSRWRYRAVVEALLALPLVLPPTVLGYYLLVATGPHSPFGRAIGTVTGHLLPFSFAGIVVGSVVYNTPFAIGPFRAAFAAIEPQLLEASWSLGVPRLATFGKVVLPLALPGILTGLALTFAHAVGEFGVVLMIGGNLPGVTRTLSISIFDQVQALDYHGASHSAAFLVAVSFMALTVTYSLHRRALSV